MLSSGPVLPARTAGIVGLKEVSSEPKLKRSSRIWCKPCDVAWVDSEYYEVEKLQPRCWSCGRFTKAAYQWSEESLSDGAAWARLYGTRSV